MKPSKLSASFFDLEPNVIYAMLFSSKNDPNTVKTFAEGGKLDQYFKIAAADSVFLWNFTNLS